MGKVIRNGLSFSGTVEEARFTKYDNSNSGLLADNVQAAIDEALCAGKTGTIYDTVIGNNIGIQNTIDAGFQQFILYGKCTQSGTPNVNTEAVITPAGKDGKIDILVTNEVENLNVFIPVKDGFPGIKVPEGGNYVDGNGQHWASDIINKRKGKYIKAVNKITFNGSENWRLETTGTSGKSRFAVNLTEYFAISDGDNSSTVIPKMCTRLASVSSTQTYNCVEGIAIRNGNIVYVYTNTTAGYSLDQFKTWLSTHTFELYYPIAIPVSFDLTNGQIDALKNLKTFAPFTNIITTDICDFEIEYFRNTPVGYSVGSLQTNIDSMPAGGGGNSNDMELTMAEYEALSEEEKMNGTVYYITDIDVDTTTCDKAEYATNAGTATYATSAGTATTANSVNASNVKAGTLVAGVKAATGTDYTTARIRNVSFGTELPTSLPNGEIFILYE